MDIHHDVKIWKCFSGPLIRESFGHRWFPFTEGSKAEFDFFFDVSLNKLSKKLSNCRWFDTLWRLFHVNVMHWSLASVYIHISGLISVGCYQYVNWGQFAKLFPQWRVGHDRIPLSSKRAVLCLLRRTFHGHNVHCDHPEEGIILFVQPHIALCFTDWNRCPRILPASRIWRKGIVFWLLFLMLLSLFFFFSFFFSFFSLLQA